MKNKILFSLCLTLLLVNSCKKDKDISDSISGYVYEEGSGNPVAGADVFLIAQEYGSWPRTEQMAHVKTDQDGKFTIKKTFHAEIDRHFLAAQGYDYYELNSTSDITKYGVSERTNTMDIYLFRKTKIKVRLLNRGDGDHIEVQSSRQTITWFNNTILDTILNLDIDAYVPTEISFSAVSSVKTIYGDTTIICAPHNSDTLLFHY